MPDLAYPDLVAATMDEDKWDDSAIVSAFQRAVDAYETQPPAPGRDAARAEAAAAAAAPQPGPWAEAAPTPDAAPGPSAADEAPVGDDGRRAGPAVATAKAGPPGLVPPSDDPELAALLMSWYYAGYQTGRYEALQEARGGAGAPR